MKTAPNIVYQPWEYVRVGARGLVLVSRRDRALLDAHPWRVAREHGGLPAAEHRYYVVAKVDSKTLRLHRVLLDACDDQLVDHVNGNGLDNRRENLRLCDGAQNARNRAKVAGSSSRYRGVTWHRKLAKWQAQIGTPAGTVYLGVFEDEREAARAYDVAALHHFGEFACLNLPMSQETA